MPTIANKLKAAGIKKPEKRGPLWLGPESDGENGGVTQSMLGRWLTCRERARVKYIEGWGPPDRFSHQLEYGQMWHTCEEAEARTPSIGPNMKTTGCAEWYTSLKEYAKGLCAKYPLDQEKIEHWYNVCKVQFPIYVEHWSKRKGTKTEPLFQEQVFKVPYSLPSGRTVYLRGKWDGSEMVYDKKRGRGLYLREFKTKGDIDVLQIQRNLTYDLPCMTYLVALIAWVNENSQDDPGFAAEWGAPVRGVNYSVVRRPLSGGKGTIKQHKPSKANPRGESKQEYYARLAEVIRGASGEDWETPEGENWFFHRWAAEITPDDVRRFRERTLDPILETLCDWYGHVTTGDPFRPYEVGEKSIGTVHQSAIHWQHPFGCVNTVDEYGASDIDELLLSGSTAGLVRSESLFRELQ